MPMMPGRVVVAVAAEEHAELRQHRDRAGDGRGDGHQQRVVIFDVREFVRDHAREFLAARATARARLSPRPRRSADCGRWRRRWAADCPSGTPAASAGRRGRRVRATSSIQVGRGAARRPHGRRTSTAPCGPSSSRRTYWSPAATTSAIIAPLGAADQIADAHEQAGEAGQQNCGLKIVHRRLPAAAAEPPRGRFQVGISPAALQDRSAASRRRGWTSERERLRGISPTAIDCGLPRTRSPDIKKPRAMPGAQANRSQPRVLDDQYLATTGPPNL